MRLTWLKFFLGRILVPQVISLRSSSSHVGDSQMVNSPKEAAAAMAEKTPSKYMKEYDQFLGHSPCPSKEYT